MWLMDNESVCDARSHYTSVKTPIWVWVEPKDTHTRSIPRVASADWACVRILVISHLESYLMPLWLPSSHSTTTVTLLSAWIRIMSGRRVSPQLANGVSDWLWYLTHSSFNPSDNPANTMFSGRLSSYAFLTRSCNSCKVVFPACFCVVQPINCTRCISRRYTGRSPFGSWPCLCNRSRRR